VDQYGGQKWRRDAKSSATALFPWRVEEVAWCNASYVVADDCLRVSTGRRSFKSRVSNVRLLKKITQNFSNLKMITAVGVICVRGHITTAQVSVADDWEWVQKSDPRWLPAQQPSATALFPWQRGVMSRKWQLQTTYARVGGRRGVLLKER
jgi:hypothetical protein